MLIKFCSVIALFYYLQVGAVVARLLEEMESEKRQYIERRRLHAHMIEEAMKERQRQKQQLLEERIKEENEIKVASFHASDRN